MKILGRLKKFEDLREVWQNEAESFTPWLAAEDNIALLGETIGIELEVEAQEQNVGPFRADILCKDTANNNWVLIENQLERTDHCHLGQLLTYAAGLEAVTIVWIAQRFTDEHRAALDWLNEKTDEDVNFFGLEIELWKIGDSDIAPKFNIVSKPNDWSRFIKDTATKGEVSGTKMMQQSYWAAFRNYVEESGSFIKCQKPLPQNWTNITIGRTNFYLVIRMNTRDKQLGIYLNIAVPNKAAYFKILEGKYKKQIEQQIGMELDWRELPEAKESHLEIYFDADPAQQVDWPRQHKWLKEKVEIFHKVLSPIVKGLDLSELKDVE